MTDYLANLRDVGSPPPKITDGGWHTVRIEAHELRIGDRFVIQRIGDHRDFVTIINRSETDGMVHLFGEGWERHYSPTRTVEVMA